MLGSYDSGRSRSIRSPPSISPFQWSRSAASLSAIHWNTACRSEADNSPAMTCGTGRSRTIGNTAIGQHIGLLLCGFAGLARPVRIGRALVLPYRRRQPVPDVIYAGDRELLVWGEARPAPDPAAPFLRQQTRLAGPIGPTADEISPVFEPSPAPTSSPLRPSRGEVLTRMDIQRDWGKWSD
jgi:hypothetical protein